MSCCSYHSGGLHCDHQYANLLCHVEDDAAALIREQLVAVVGVEVEGVALALLGHDLCAVQVQLHAAAVELSGDALVHGARAHAVSMVADLGVGLQGTTREGEKVSTGIGLWTI